VTQHFGLRGREEIYNPQNKHFKSAKNENGRVYVMFAETNPTKMRISSLKLQGRMVIPRLVATSEKKLMSSWHV